MKTYILAHDEARRRAVEAVRTAEPGMVVRISPKTRSLVSNALMWVLLGEIAEQVTWHGQKLLAEEWKDMATAALKNQKVVPGIGGGFVVLGARTSKMTSAEMAELIDFLYAFGVEHEVKFSEPPVNL